MGKEKSLAIGRYPEIGLARARKGQLAARELLVDGRDPSAVKQLERDRRLAEYERTFRALTEEFLQKQEQEGRSPSTLKKNRWVLDMALADIGNEPATALRAPAVLKVLKKVEARGTYETARRLKVMIGAVMRYGMAIGWVDSDPTIALRGALMAPPKKPHAAITDRANFGELLRAIDGMSGQPSTRVGLQLLALLYPRPGELRFAKWTEFDLDKRAWTIPADRTKTRRPHRAPLSDAAIEKIRELKALNAPGDYLFPSIRTWRKPISDAAFTAALRRIGFSGDEMTAHGFRASFSTIANESGLWNPDAIERALAHVEGNAVRAAYSRSDFWDERVRMADWWAGLLDELRQSAPTTRSASGAGQDIPSPDSVVDRRWIGQR
jgi:integrase